MTNRNPLWDLIQEFMDDPQHKFGAPKVPDLARSTQISDKVIYKWKDHPTLPQPEQLMAFAKGTGLDYLDLLAAALEGRGYLPLGREIVMEWRREAQSAYEFNQPRKDGEHGGDAAATSKRSDFDLATRKVNRKSKADLVREEQDAAADDQ